MHYKLAEDPAKIVMGAALCVLSTKRHHVHQLMAVSRFMQLFKQPRPTRCMLCVSGNGEEPARSATQQPHPACSAPVTGFNCSRGPRARQVTVWLVVTCQASLQLHSCIDRQNRCLVGIEHERSELPPTCLLPYPWESRLQDYAEANSTCAKNHSALAALEGCSGQEHQTHWRLSTCVPAIVRVPFQVL